MPLPFECIGHPVTVNHERTKLAAAFSLCVFGLVYGVGVVLVGIAPGVALALVAGLLAFVVMRYFLWH